MLALGIMESCRLRKLLSAPGSSICFDMAFSRRLFISAAAALVKVVMRNLSISVFSSMTSLVIRSISTAVFPDPAAADTRIFFPLVSIVSFCGFVHSISASILFSFSALFSRLPCDIPIISDSPPAEKALPAGISVPVLPPGLRKICQHPEIFMTFRHK